MRAQQKSLSNNVACNADIDRALYVALHIYRYTYVPVCIMFLNLILDSTSHALLTISSLTHG